MSHVATIDIEVKDLDMLQAACKRIGMEFVRDQKTYKWWGRHMGDYPIPAGFTSDDLGKCDHAIRSPEASYEIGLVKRRDGRPGWTLLWDFIDYRLVKAVGKDGCKLKSAYAAVAATQAARKSGFRVRELLRADGSIELQLTR